MVGDNNNGGAENIFFDAALGSAERHLEGHRLAQGRGAEEISDTHLNRAGQAILDAAQLTRSPGFEWPALTAEENQRLQLLEAQKGIGNGLDSVGKETLADLYRKAGRQKLFRSAAG